MRTIVEVGANSGSDTVNFLNQPDTRVIAFEPTPELVLHLRNRFKGNPNFTLYPAAVCEVNGWSEFNIAGSADWGCSSLSTFNPDVHNQWPNRPDFHFTDKCIVPTVRLDTILDMNNVDSIDYLHIDAQGHDFDVLKSLGKYVSIVKAGICESAHNINLYENTNNSTKEIVSWLESNGFSHNVSPNDEYFAEAQIRFFR